MKYLIVVDMQNDFITGSLGTAEARAIVDLVAKRARDFDGEVVFTLDTHDVDYLSTQEGSMLPVPHCIKGTDGWRLADKIDAVRIEREAPLFEKRSFGSVDLASHLANISHVEAIESIELVGLCTDICVVSNALLFKAFMPEVPIIVDASCCAGVTPESHRAALKTMRSCQIVLKHADRI